MKALARFPATLNVEDYRAFTRWYVQDDPERNRDRPE